MDDAVHFSELSGPAKGVLGFIGVECGERRILGVLVRIGLQVCLASHLASVLRLETGLVDQGWHVRPWLYY
jgi:hypothetical protein